MNNYEGQGYTFDRIIDFVNCVALTPLYSSFGLYLIIGWYIGADDAAQEFPTAVLAYHRVLIMAEEDQLGTIGFAGNHKYPFGYGGSLIAVDMNRLVREQVAGLRH